MLIAVVVGICILLAILGFLVTTLSKSHRAASRNRVAGKNTGAKLPF